MRVIVKIAGKEALPVRAIPFLTDWKRWTPDVLASVFAGTADRALAISGSVRTFRLVDGAIVPVLPDWWLSFPVNQLAALDDRLREGGEPSAASYDRWRLEALRLLPEAVYVWFDEFTEFHSRDWIRRMRVLGPNARSYPEIAARLEAEGLLGESDRADRGEVPLSGLLGSEETRDMVRDDLEALLAIRFLDRVPLIPKVFRDTVAEGIDIPPDRQPVAGRVLTHAEDEEITRRLAAGESVSSLAREFGVSRPAIDKRKPDAKAKPKATFVSGLVRPKAR